MLFLLRKLRNKMIQKNKVSNYLLYAIGEIVLVVVGILIAVQIDEFRKKEENTDLRNALLKEIASDLQLSINALELDNTLIFRVIAANKFVISHLDSKPIDTDSIEYYYGKLYGLVNYNINNTGYESLKSIGFNLLKQDSLRLAITTFYTGDYVDLKSYVQIDNNFTSNTLIPLLTKHIKSKERFYYGDAFPLNFEKLKSNNEFREALLYHITLKLFMNEVGKETIIKMKKLKSYIQQNISK